MACNESKSRLVLPLVVLLASLNFIKLKCVNGTPQVPCLFIFGDSLSDSGNNNDLHTLTKSNYNPYGIDFPAGPTGRFSNGLTEIDIISQFMGFENFIPPFGNTSGSDILKGVNYAAGSAGILVETSSYLGETVSLGRQIANHRVIVSRIADILGGLDKARSYLSKCLYYVNIGSNDYMNNYYLPQFYPSSLIYTPQQFAHVLIDELSFHIQHLHDLGARKYALAGLGLLGCTPGAVKAHGASPGSTCFDDENAASFIFSTKLASLVDLYKNNLSPDSSFIYINTSGAAISNSDGNKGFTATTTACCETVSSGLCVAEGSTCPNRGEYVFWDDHHTTEAWNRLNAEYAYYGEVGAGSTTTHPMSIKHLVQQETVMEPGLLNFKRFRSSRFAATI